VYQLVLSLKPTIPFVKHQSSLSTPCDQQMITKARGASRAYMWGGFLPRFLGWRPSVDVPFELDALFGGAPDGRRKHGTGFHQGSWKIA
jgi:hypothetical protein